MYEGFFSLQSRPFRAYAGPGGFVPVGQLENLLQQALAALLDGAGVAVVTGPTGTGKTAFAHEVAERTRARLLPVSVGCTGVDSVASLWQTVLFELGESYLGLTEDEARLKILESARKETADSEGILLLLDDAHCLSPAILAQLPALTSQRHAGRPLVRLLLSGQFELEESLASAEVDSLNQQIGCHNVLEPLSRDESAEFICRRLAAAGGECEEIFEEEAIHLICRIADGNPRCLNHLCDQSLLLACIDGIPTVSPSIVMAALDDLKGLPLHWNVPTRAMDSEVDHGDDPEATTEIEASNGTEGEIESSETESKDAWWTADDHAVVLEVGAESGCDNMDDDGRTSANGVMREEPAAQQAQKQDEIMADASGEIDSANDGPRVNDAVECREFSVEDHYAALDSAAERQRACVPLRNAAFSRSERDGVVAMSACAAPAWKTAKVPLDLHAGDEFPGEQHGIEQQLANELSELQKEIRALTTDQHAPCDTPASTWDRADAENGNAWDVIQPDDGTENDASFEATDSCAVETAQNATDCAEPTTDDSGDETADEVVQTLPVEHAEFGQRRYERLFSRLRRRRRELTEKRSDNC